MQRLGFLKSVVSIASPGQGQTLEALTKKIETTIRRAVELPDALLEPFERYVSRFRLHARYPQSASSKTVELQDAYLSDPRLPSASGAITGELERVGYRHAVYVEVPTWATRLLLVRDHNYSLTDRGKVLRLISTDETWDRFEPGGNPFLVSSGQAFFFLYCLLATDGDVLRLAYRRILHTGRGTFERAELGTFVAEALEELVRTRLRKETSGAATQQVQRALKTIESIHLQRGSAYGPRESVATPRAEPLVDCGVLRKRDPAYTYSFTELGTRVLSRLAESPSVTTFMRNDLASLLWFGEPPTGEPSLASVRAVYDALKSGLGYVSIPELIVGSIAESLAAKRPPHSLHQLESMLLAAPAKYGPLVRLAQGRVGGIAQVRIHSDAFRESDRA